MRWHGFSGFKYYASAAIALVGLSAASTLLTDRVSLAQQPTVEERFKAGDDGSVNELELVEKLLKEKLGTDHPKLREVHAQLDQARAQAKARAQALKAAQAAGKAESVRRVTVQSGEPVTVTSIASTDGDILTENIIGNQSVVVRRTADGQEIHEVLAGSPKELRGLSLFGNAKQNSELQKAIEKYKDKDASDKDKQEAKDKIMSLLGKQFDEDMDQRAKQVAELEKKVTTLKEQIVKRKEAKQKIIDLRIEVLMNEMEGLGFPSSGPLPLLNAIGSPATFRAVTVPGAPIPPAPPVSSVAPAAPVSPVAPAAPPVPEK